jgi:prepilin-type N-terminal cleavage/methylation domain-containing protein
MRKGFTLIELMIVIAIIAIIAAIAIPNLLESRITANEANAATSLKSGMFPGQVQYQNGGYVDVDADGRGVFAAHPSFLAGATGAGDVLDAAPVKAISLIEGKFNNTAGQAGVATQTINTAAANAANAGAYDYHFYVNTTNGALGTATSAEDEAESFWGGVAVPKDTNGSEGRRAFAINAAGGLIQTKGTLTQANTTVALILADFGADGTIFATDPRFTIASANTGNDTGSTPYQK